MTATSDLTGHAILVVEDDYYLASDTTLALRDAGAEVLGPCSSEESARVMIASERLTGAVLDLNLSGGGPSLAIAHLLQARGIPFVIVSGYDPEVMPPQLAGVEHLQKPVQLCDVIEAVGRF